MHAITRRHLLKLGLASGALLAAGSQSVEALVNIVVTGGNFTPPSSACAGCRAREAG